MKSGYWLACSLDQSDVRRSSKFKPSLNDLRSKIWKINTAPKIKVFLWKALSNALAVSEECEARGMKVDPRCQRCGEIGESINHVLFKCLAARLVWATSGFPFLPRGFEHRGLYANFGYLLNADRDKSIPKELWRVFPWILWMIWKNKNTFCFEGREFAAEDTVAKCFEDSKRWFDALEEAKVTDSDMNRRSVAKKIWKNPTRNKVKCNIGISWSKETKLAGTGWIVRTNNGGTLLHSRRAFSGVASLMEAKRLGFIWALESVISHRLHNIIFEIEADELVGAINRPKAWPAFRADGLEMREVLSKIGEWEVCAVNREVNRAAFMIARSVTKEKRLQSYVAQGSPSWLRTLLAEEGAQTG